MQTEGGATVSSPSLDNKTEWQRVELDFTSDGSAPTVVILTAKHNSAGSEKIIGFDNIVIRRHNPVGIDSLHGVASQLPWYDLSGRRIEVPTRPGIYVNGRRKVVR